MLRTLILAGVALGLLLFIVFVERGSLSTTELEGRKGRVLDNFVRERVTRVELQRHGVKTVLVKVPPNPNDPLDTGGWRVEAPYRAKADREVVDSLLSALEWAEARRSLGDASAAELKQFGLEAPRYRVSFVAGRDSSGFAIGGPDADGGGAYLKRSEGSAVFVVSKEVLESLDHEPVDFHDKNLHEGLTALTLERLTLQAGSEERRVQRRAGFFWLEKPWPALASSPELSSLMDALDGMRASRYVADTVKESYGLGAPRLRVEVESLVYKDGEKGQKSKPHKELLALRIGAACAGHAHESYLQLGEGSVYCVADAEWKKLDKRAEELREPRVLPLDDSAITAVKLQDGQRELSLTPQDQTTRRRLTDHGRELHSGIADPAALGEFYAALRAAKVEQFGALTPAARTQLEQNALIGRFERGKDDAAFVLHVARAEPLAVRSDDPELLTVAPSVNELLTPMAARFRKKRVLDENEAQFSALTLTRAGGASERVVKTGAGYELATPLSGFAERGPVDEILRLASKLDALRFVADAPRPEHGLAAPYRSLRLEYTSDGKARTHSLDVGEKTTGGRFAKLDADPAVFVVAEALLSKLEQPLPRRVQ